MIFQKILLFWSVLVLSLSAQAWTVVTQDPALQAPYYQLIAEAFQYVPTKWKASLPTGLQFKLQPGFSHVAGQANGAVALNEDLFRDFVQNPQKSGFAAFSRHPDFKTYLLASLIHEISHEYDFSGLNLPISRDPEFLNLIFQYSTVGQKPVRKRGNYFEERSVDPYEFKNPAEAFAVHMEFFLLDPEFQCRKPSLYRYFSKKFQHAPFAGTDCTRFARKFYLSPTLSSMQPEIRTPQGKLYQIHYFLAGPGEGVVSGYGHSMLRLVYCDPERATASEKCLDDVDQHVIISPAAGILDFDYSVYNGLSGKYPTFMFGSDVSAKIIEYTKIEEREVFSIPLNLNEAQLQTLETAILEAHWTYKNKYYFLSNNCAVEVLNILKRAMPENPSLQNIREIKPVQLLESLHSIGLVTNKDFAYWRQDKKKRFYFPSIADTLNKLEQYLARYLHSRSAENYRNLLLPERRSLVAQVKNLNPDAKTKLGSAIEYLEKNIQMKLSLKLLKEVTAELASRSKGPNKIDSLEKYKKEYSIWMSPPQILQVQNYGLPSQDEIEDIIVKNAAVFNGTNIDMQKNLTDLSLKTSQKFPEWKEMEAITEMLQELEVAN